MKIDCEIYDNAKTPKELYEIISKGLARSFVPNPMRPDGQYDVQYLQEFNDAEEDVMRHAAIRIRAENPSLNLPHVPSKGNKIDILNWCIDADKIFHGKDKKRRGAGELKDHVEEAYGALFDIPTTQAKHIANWINKIHGDKYRKVTADSVRNTNAWEKRHPKNGEK